MRLLLLLLVFLFLPAQASATLTVTRGVDPDVITIIWDTPGCLVWEQPAYQASISIICTATGDTFTIDTSPPDQPFDAFWHPRLDTFVSLRTGDGRRLAATRIPPRSVLHFPFVRVGGGD